MIRIELAKRRLFSFSRNFHLILWKNKPDYMEDYIMFEEIMNGFMSFLCTVKKVFDVSYNDKYAGWDEWREIEMFRKTNMGL